LQKGKNSIFGANIHKMIQSLQVFKQVPISVSSLTRQIKFERRSDLSLKDRLVIGVTCVVGKRYGTVTNLSKKYAISRTCVYNFEAQMRAGAESIFGVQSSELASKKAELSAISSKKALLLLRLEGGCTHHSIANLLPHFGYAHNSLGYISQSLDKMGSQLSPVLNWQGACVFASDEIFYIEHKPILMTVDIVSHAILKIQKLESLTKDAWIAHWQDLLDKGITPIKLITDEGVALQSARSASFDEAMCQSDTFHSVAYRLGIFYDRLERQAEKNISNEYDFQAVSQNAKSATIRDKNYIKWQNAQQITDNSLQLLEDFTVLYHYILQQFNVFSTTDGTIRSRVQAEQTTATALEMLEKLPIKGINDQIKDIRRVLPHLFTFLDTAKKGFDYIAKDIDPLVLPYWTSAWQRLKKAAKIKNNYHKQKRMKSKAQSDLDLISDYYKEDKDNIVDFYKIKDTIFYALEIACAQSSAAVENVNSFIRPFLNQCRGQITQNTLNLLMFFHNHSPFDTGKRKGKAPIEILSGQKLDAHWADLIINSPTGA
jgi:hypothetical protein